MEIVMPKMGESVSEGTIIKWHKKMGDIVKRDEIIFEISTDKVDTEIPASADGILTKINVKEGETVEVGTVVAILSTESEAESIVSSSQKLNEEAPVTSIKNEPTTVKIDNPISNSFIDIAMPKMGESVMEGTVIKWHKKVGDQIKKDEIIFEISTDKVDTEIPSPEGGILIEILVKEQETVSVGTIVARLSISSRSGVAESVTSSVQEQIAEKTVEPLQMHDNFQSTIQPIEESTAEIGFLSPLVLSIASKENVTQSELKKIIGTGHEGRITKKDILAFIQSRKTSEVHHHITHELKTELPKPSAMPAPSFVPAVSSQSFGDGVEKIPMDNIRQKIMQHMVSSRDTSVHVSAMLEVDMTKIHNFIQKNKDEYQKRDGVKLTYMAFIANACVRSLTAYPLVNSSIDGTNILKKKFVNLGIAVAIEPNGLIVPNIKGAENLNTIGLAKAINDLAFRSRNKKLTPDDISGGTFTITNYGVFGTIFGTPIINQPEVAIIGVGAVVKKPVVIEVDGMDTIAIKPIMSLTISHDHRIIDGMLGGMFLKYIKDTLENFDPANL
jgi:2-oxoglutarate dehydrogenase E2 component (dihydrolipoamide succinyltransferase)